MTTDRKYGTPPTGFESVAKFVEKYRQICEPDEVFWCDGSEEEKQFLLRQAVNSGVLEPLNQEKLPGCYYHRSNPNDVARVEQCTYICTPSKEDAGPTNNWAPPRDMYDKLHGLLRQSMRGRTMYVVPYLMGPPGSPLRMVGVELTDSIYVVLNMRVMSRMGRVALEQLTSKGDFNRGVHCTLNLDPSQRFICHFPQDNTILSVGSGYGGNVLLGKKCLALRIGSWLGRQQGWLAEHMLLLSVESPTGDKTYVAAAFPSACGKTNFSMMIPPAPFSGWKVKTIGDDIAWMRPGKDGRLWAINPEAGYFGVAPGTNFATNPNAMKSIQTDTIYTNVAVTPDGDVWWEGKDGPVPEKLTDWKGNPWTPQSMDKAAHPNSRFTAPMQNNPALAEEVNHPDGVPISAIIFGGRRATTMPLVFQSFNWIHGVYLGATMASETTAAAAGELGRVRRDPMAMLPFCGYHMGDYFNHWMNIRRELNDPPRIFHVNWFRKGKDGSFLWPGYGENFRVLKWVIDRCRGRAPARETAIGWMPRFDEFDWQGLPFAKTQWDELMFYDAAEWRRELLWQEEFLLTVHDRLPKELIFQRELLISRL
jgi:phosphoenolpyruvate carboxykinase (GTP)